MPRRDVPELVVLTFPSRRELARRLPRLLLGVALGGTVGIGTVLFAFGIGPLGHWFLARLHLGVGGVDPDPAATIGE
jgi:hypothetical protein